MRKTGIFILLLLISLSCLTACSGRETTIESGTLPLSEFEPVTGIVEGRTDIYLIVKLVDSSYWQVIINGVKDAGEALGCNVYCGGTTNEIDWKGQRKLIEEAMARNADAIILAPDDSIELAPDIENIHEAGIPVVLIDTAANTESYDICYMTDNLLAGQNAAREMLRQLNSCGHSESESLCVGIMAGMATSQTINERLAGFYKYWSENAPDNWTIASDIMNCNGNIDIGDELAESFLKEHPDAYGLYGTNNGPTRVLCNIVREKSRTDIVVVGFDFSDEMKELIESPDYCASTMLQRQYDMGSRAVGSVLSILKGDVPPIRFEDTGVVTVNSDTLTDPDVEELLKHN